MITFFQFYMFNFYITRTNIPGHPKHGKLSFYIPKAHRFDLKYTIFMDVVFGVITIIVMNLCK